MDAINTIKVTVEPTNKEPVVKSENTVVAGVSGNSEAGTEKKDSFSDTLKGEMENKSDSQKNDGFNNPADEKNNTGGNNLPDEKQTSIAVVENVTDATLINTASSEIDASHQSDKTTTAEVIINALDNQSVPEDLLKVVDNQLSAQIEDAINVLDNKATLDDFFDIKVIAEDLVNAIDNKSMSENLVNAIDNKSMSEDLINTLAIS